MITNCSNLSEILWNFNRCPTSRGQRVTLVENPHFYHRRDLPITSPNASQDGLIIYPMDYFQDQDTKDISVLTSKPGRVLLELGDNSRAFDQVWRANGILILKSQCLVVFFSFFWLTLFQTSVEGSRVKVSLRQSFKAGPAGGALRGLYLLGLRNGKRYGTGKRQFTMFYIHKMSRYALLLFPNRFSIERVRIRYVTELLGLVL